MKVVVVGSGILSSAKAAALPAGSSQGLTGSRQHQQGQKAGRECCCQQGKRIAALADGSISTNRQQDRQYQQDRHHQQAHACGQQAAGQSCGLRIAHAKKQMLQILIRLITQACLLPQSCTEQAAAAY